MVLRSSRRTSTLSPMWRSKPRPKPRPKLSEAKPKPAALPASAPAPAPAPRRRPTRRSRASRRRLLTQVARAFLAELRVGLVVGPALRALELGRILLGRLPVVGLVDRLLRQHL